MSWISIHAPLAGCDFHHCFHPPLFSAFQSTHPLRGATGGDIEIKHFAVLFQSTHPLRGATARSARGQGRSAFQSTHPLRGATQSHLPAVCQLHAFQSTHPLRGATRPHIPPLQAKNFNPRTPCGVRPGKPAGAAVSSDFNPRTPCGVRRWRRRRADQLRSDFNPRTPCGVRRAPFPYFAVQAEISIHAPLAGCDARNNRFDFSSLISIHAPLAGCDLINQMLLADPEKFQSTHPLRGATRPTITTRPS